MEVEPAALPLPPSTDQTISTAASASARISGLKRGFFGCKKINSSSDIFMPGFTLCKLQA